jgi:DNA gyrase subunit A
VRGIRLKPGQRVVSCAVVDTESTLLTVCENGYGKRTPVEEYREIKRGGQGVRTIVVNERNGDVVHACCIRDTDALLLITQQGVAIRMKVDGLRPMGRNTQGVRIVKVGESDHLVAAIPIDPTDLSEEELADSPEEAVEASENPEPVEGEDVDGGGEEE